MKQLIFKWWGIWVVLGGCAWELVALGIGEQLSRWEQFVWVTIVTAWIFNYSMTVRASDRWKRLYESERQRTRSMWS